MRLFSDPVTGSAVPDESYVPDTVQMRNAADMIKQSQLAYANAYAFDWSASADRPERTGGDGLKRSILLGSSKYPHHLW